jgi:hypothetical protein
MMERSRFRRRHHHSAYPIEFSQQPLAEAGVGVGVGVGSCSGSGLSSEDIRARDQHEELPVMPPLPTPTEQESRDGHHHARRCVRERRLGEDRQDRRWEFRHC